MYEQVHCRDEAANHQLPISAAFWIIWVVSAKECSSFMQNLMQNCCSIHSVLLNVMATQYTCSLNGIHCPHWLVQWSHHCSCMHLPVHSPWLPGYIDVTQTILVILTMAGLFLDRPHKHAVKPIVKKPSQLFVYSWQPQCGPSCPQIWEDDKVLDIPPEEEATQCAVLVWGPLPLRPAVAKLCIQDLMLDSSIPGSVTSTRALLFKELFSES